MSDFYVRYKTYTKQQIFEILLKKEDYQVDAVKAAELILAENKWDTDLKDLFDKENEIYQEEISEKAEYYRKAVEFQKDRNYFNIRTSNVPKFEAKLVKHNIDFFRENKNVGVQLDSYPTETYYFKEKDVATVDKICIDLKLVTQPYADAKPFFRFEIKVILIVVVILASLVLFINS